MVFDEYMNFISIFFLYLFIYFVVVGCVEIRREGSKNVQHWCRFSGQPKPRHHSSDSPLPPHICDIAWGGPTLNAGFGERETHFLVDWKHGWTNLEQVKVEFSYMYTIPACGGKKIIYFFLFGNEEITESINHFNPTLTFKTRQGIGQPPGLFFSLKVFEAVLCTHNFNGNCQKYGTILACIGFLCCTICLLLSLHHCQAYCL